MMGLLNRSLLPLLGVLSVAFLWYMMTRVNAGDPSIIGYLSPEATWTAISALLIEAEIYRHLSASLNRALIGLAFAV